MNPQHDPGTSRRTFLHSSVAAVSGTLAAQLAAPGAASGASVRPKARLVPGDSQDVFDFETERIRGTIRLDGRYHGVTKLTDKRTGRQVIDSRYSALNFFKLMSVNQVMGEPRTMERTIRSGRDWVEVTWPLTDSHQAEVIARYEVVEDAVDLTLTVRCQGTYRAYEVFMPNYFDKAFRPHVYLWTRGRRDIELVKPTANDVFRETVLVFARDSHAARHCIDGRWERNELGRSIVQMCPVRHYARCLAFMVDRESRLGVVLMSRPEDCYAISTRYHADNDADRLTDYSAFDLSLFGDDFIPNQERSVRVRLALTPVDSDLSEPLAMYRAFESEMKEG